MKFTRSLFSNKIVKEEMEDIHKALVLAHSHFTSQGKFEDALKISNLLAINQNKDGNFNLEAKNQILKKEPCEQNEVTEVESEYSDQLNEELELFFNTIGKYNMEKCGPGGVICKRSFYLRMDVSIKKILFE